MDITDDIWNYPNLAEYKTQIERSMRRLEMEVRFGESLPR